MPKLKKIIKLPLKPYWKLKKKLNDIYVPHRYWEKRHKMYGNDSLKGVGHIGKTEDENLADYQEASKIFLSLCNNEGIDFANSSILEIGCGNGFYTNIILQQGCKDYTGVDIAETPLKDLRRKYPDYNFHQFDITKKSLEKQFDMILMIDVTQHIVDDKLFNMAMNNIKEMLKTTDSVFITTDWLVDSKIRRRPYEVARSLSYYQSQFSNHLVSKPIKFRDKFVFTIKKVAHQY